MKQTYRKTTCKSDSLNISQKIKIEIQTKKIESEKEEETRSARK